MLMISRSETEGVTIFDGEWNVIARIVVDRYVRIGIEAPQKYRILRDELIEKSKPDSDRIAS